jgi:hypothetical protein
MAMAYNDFTLEALKRQFDLRTHEGSDLFGQVTPVPISDLLRETLQEGVPLALDISTEKARSELIIAPVLMEARRQFGGRVSLFSGVEFNVDLEQGLRGVCDFLLSLSPEQLAIEAPVVAVVEAKNENIKQGIVQCTAELVASQRFNRERDNPVQSVFGAVTTGSIWKFLRLVDSVISVDQSEYHISQVERIVAILLSMLREAGGQGGVAQSAT